LLGTSKTPPQIIDCFLQRLEAIEQLFHDYSLFNFYDGDSRQNSKLSGIYSIIMSDGLVASSRRSGLITQVPGVGQESKG
jgi:hypothetical protein